MEFSDLSKRVIGCAIEVHRHLGPGLLESAYRDCLGREFELQGIKYMKEYPVPVEYKGKNIGCGFFADMLVEGEIVLELKSVTELHPVHIAQLLTYMKLMKLKQGFLMNFNVERLKDGLKSFVF